MNAEIRTAKSFLRDAKALMKKYPSLLDDLEELKSELLDNPTLGVPIGNNAYKIRMAIRSKRKGKSGGARVISFVENEVIGLVEMEEDLVVVNLIAIYDKSERETMPAEEVRELIAKMEI